MKIILRVEDVINVKTRDAMSTGLIHVNLWSTMSDKLNVSSRTCTVEDTLSVESSTQ